MASKHYPSINQITQQILREVKAEQQIKTAEQQMLQQALHPQVSTELGQQLTKLAQHLRHVPEEPAISYADLQQFMRHTHAG